MQPTRGPSCYGAKSSAQSRLAPSKCIDKDTQFNVMRNLSQNGKDPNPSRAPRRNPSEKSGGGFNIIQLNVEGLSSSKLNIIEQLAINNKASIILLQETHWSTSTKLALPNYVLAGFITSRTHGLATFVRQNLSWSHEGQSPSSSDIEWICTNVHGNHIVNVYKPPPSHLSTTSLPVFPPPCIYAGDFNCQHTTWGYRSNSTDGELLANWASNSGLTLLYHPKDEDSFHSARWNTGTNPDLAFAATAGGLPLPERRVLAKFPRSQHRPSLITAGNIVASVTSKPAKRWNFRKAD